MSVTELYDKDVLNKIELCFYHLNKTGSYDDRENQVVVVTVPTSLAYSMRDVHRAEKVRGVSDIELVRIDNSNMMEVYCGGSYGSGQLLGAIGTMLYYSKDFGAEFEGQY